MASDKRERAWITTEYLRHTDEWMGEGAHVCGMLEPGSLLSSPHHLASVGVRKCLHRCSPDAMGKPRGIRWTGSPRVPGPTATSSQRAQEEIMSLCTCVYTHVWCVHACVVCMGVCTCVVCMHGVCVCVCMVRVRVWCMHGVCTCALCAWIRVWYV